MSNWKEEINQSSKCHQDECAVYHQVNNGCTCGLVELVEKHREDAAKEVWKEVKTELEVAVCDCGRPCKESDLFDTAVEKLGEGHAPHPENCICNL